MQGVGKLLISMGIILCIAGVVVLFLGRFNIPLGNLPVDITYTRKNVTVFAPITTMLVVSVVLTIVLNIIGRWMK